MITRLEVIQLPVLSIQTNQDLAPHQLQGTASGELGVGAGLMKDLVAWGFKNTGQAITLNDLSATIFASRSSIVHHCRQSFGTGLKQMAQPGASRPQLPGGAADHRRQHRA